MTTTLVRATCPHDCPDTCALLVTVEDGVATEVKGDPDHPTTAGVLCTKVARYVERTYHPDRLLTRCAASARRAKASSSHQLGRGARRDRGAPEADRRARSASHPALQLLRHHGPGAGRGDGDALLQQAGRLLPRPHRVRDGRLYRLQIHHRRSIGTDIEQFQDAKLILIWGGNPIASNLHFWMRAQEAKRRGAKLIAIDPYRSLTAEKCHQHIALLPGTDARWRWA
jgi:hypothetical protein